MLYIGLFIFVWLLVALRLGKSNAKDCDSRVLIVAAHMGLKLIPRYAPLGLHSEIYWGRCVMRIILDVWQEARGTF